jgi:hypothetical protein
MTTADIKRAAEMAPQMLGEWIGTAVEVVLLDHAEDEHVDPNIGELAYRILNPEPDGQVTDDVARKQAELEFVGARYLHNGSGLNFTAERCCGTSSDALAWYGVGIRGEPSEDEYPRDTSDLEACERTYGMAPPEVQERMLPILERYRTKVHHEPCSGHVTNHNDGTYECTNQACPGPLADHRSYTCCKCPECHRRGRFGCIPGFFSATLRAPTETPEPDESCACGTELRTCPCGDQRCYHCDPVAECDQ